jgi:hypothetical protein
MKAPVPQNRDYPIVNAMTQTLKKPFSYHCALCVNCDFHNYVALNTAWQL